MMSTRFNVKMQEIAVTIWNNWIFTIFWMMEKFG